MNEYTKYPVTQFSPKPVMSNLQAITTNNRAKIYMRLPVPVTVWPILSCVLYEITAPGKEDPNGCEARKGERKKRNTYNTMRCTKK